MTVTGSKVRVSSAQLEWLRNESGRWHADGLIDGGVRAGILAGYEAESPERRGMLALVVVGILICAFGLLLLIGYNWSHLAPAAKVTLILAGVTGAFGASALAYRSGRQTAGEALAFAGTLIFANAIWLIAQVLHIQGHFPDGFLWAGIGALVCAYLVRSTWNGIAAAALILAWAFAEGLAVSGHNYAFLLLWPAAVGVARHLESRAMLGVAALAAIVWVGTLDLRPSPGIMWPASLVLAGCALHAVGSWEDGRGRLGGAWRTVGLATLLVLFVPLMIVDAQAELVREGPAATPLLVLFTAAFLALVAFSGTLRARTAVDWTIAGVAIAVCAWTGAIALGVESTILGAVVFSLAALAVCVALVRTALTTGRVGQLATGVLFAVAFLLVRWISLIENMLWSGALLLVAGGGLLVIAKLWKSRQPGSPVAGGGA